MVYDFACNMGMAILEITKNENLLVHTRLLKPRKQCCQMEQFFTRRTDFTKSSLMLVYLLLITLEGKLCLTNFVTVLFLFLQPLVKDSLKIYQGPHYIAGRGGSEGACFYKFLTN